MYSLPKGMSKLRFLKAFWIENNQLDGFPTEIRNLKTLEILKMNGG
ncbi:hypothetical protein [Candidatus Uabimicrobium sp. HlEnr_7]